VTVNIDRQTAEIIRAFLISPLRRSCFDRFFRLCCTETTAHLRRLCAAGWQLPEDQVQHENSLTDLACDLLGPFLASEKDRPFYTVFDYYQHHGITDFACVDADDLERHFRILLRGFIGKELTVIRGLYNPQVKNLKRRIRETLNDSDYTSKVWPGEKHESVIATRHQQALRDNLPPLPRYQLIALVRQAFRLSYSRTRWCAAIFELLNDKVEVRNALSLGELVSVMVAVNAEFVDAAGHFVGRLPDPTEEYLRKRITVAIEESLDWLGTSVITRFISKGRLATSDGPLVLQACRRYLSDLGLTGLTDSVPAYFMALKPKLTQATYIRQYKYVLDTAVSRGLDELRRRLREDSTIWPFGSYSPDEE